MEKSQRKLLIILTILVLIIAIVLGYSLYKKHHIVLNIATAPTIHQNKLLFVETGSLETYDRDTETTNIIASPKVTQFFLVPGSTKIFYLNQGNLWTEDVEGGNQKQITTDGSMTDFVVSPDAQHIVFRHASSTCGLEKCPDRDTWNGTCNDDTPNTCGALEIINIDGTNPIHVDPHLIDPAGKIVDTLDIANLQEVSWFPDSVHILLTDGGVSDHDGVSMYYQTDLTSGKIIMFNNDSNFQWVPGDNNQLQFINNDQVLFYQDDENYDDGHINQGTSISIYTLSTKSKKEIYQMRGSLIDNIMSLSPDKQKIAFSESGNNFYFKIISIDGKELYSSKEQNYISEDGGMYWFDNNTVMGLESIGGFAFVTVRLDLLTTTITPLVYKDQNPLKVISISGFEKSIVDSNTFYGMAYTVPINGTGSNTLVEADITTGVTKDTQPFTTSYLYPDNVIWVH